MRKIGEKERPTQQNAALSARSCLGYRILLCFSFFFLLCFFCFFFRSRDYFLMCGGGRRSFLYLSLSLSWRVQRRVWRERGPFRVIFHFRFLFVLESLFSLSLDVRFALVLVLPPQIERASECRRPTTTKRTLGALLFLCTRCWAREKEPDF